VSEYFRATNGVKQGAVLSPILFCIYIDDLLLLLSKVGVGCYIGSRFTGALAYADDIVLIAPTPLAMRKLLNVCEKYANEYNIQFNASKTKSLIVKPLSYSKPVIDCVFTLNDIPIENVRSFTHLGHVIGYQMNDKEDILARRNKFNSQVNDLLCFFRKQSTAVQYRLFNQYCTSYYGCEIWQLTNPAIEDICIAWRKSLRRIWNLPYRTHSYLLALISNCLPIFDEICRRSLNFVSRCILEGNALTRFIVLHGLYFARGFSMVGQNVMFCMQRFRCLTNCLFSQSVSHTVRSWTLQSIDCRMRQQAAFLKELILLRHGSLVLPSEASLNFEQLNDIIEAICTS
jgi:hypothetical protein